MRKWTKDERLQMAAIRRFCKENCKSGSQKRVALCRDLDCSLFPFKDKETTERLCERSPRCPE